MHEGTRRRALFPHRGQELGQPHLIRRRKKNRCPAEEKENACSTQVRGAQRAPWRTRRRFFSLLSAQEGEKRKEGALGVRAREAGRRVRGVERKKKSTGKEERTITLSSSSTPPLRPPLSLSFCHPKGKRERLFLGSLRLLPPTPLVLGSLLTRTSLTPPLWSRASEQASDRRKEESG